LFEEEEVWRIFI